MIVEFLAVPGILLILGALILPLIPKSTRSSVFLLFPILSLAVVFTRPDGYELIMSLANLDLTLMKSDALSKLFGIIFSATALVAGIYAWHIRDLGQQSSALLYAGGALGVTYAGDLFTLLVFWEIMAVSSTWLVWARRTKEADAAGMRYLLFHVLGGGLLLAGILLHMQTTGSILVESLEPSTSLASILMLMGVCVNAAVIPLHAWLPDAYPKATITGAVFMSAFTTKSAVYVLIRVFPGWELLIWAGAAMAIYGVLYAVICKDLREILAYHIVSQVGFMVCGIGIGTEMALNGAAAHAYSHILYKSLMFMAAGAVLYATGTTKLVDLGGLKNKMKWTMGLYLVGAFSISGLPLFNGYISKSMTISAAGYADNEAAMLLLLLASVGTFLSVGLKLPYYTWFHKTDSDLPVRPLPRNMYLAMSIAAGLCIFYGLVPGALYTYLPFATSYNPFTIYHFVEVTQISIMTFVAFWVFKKKMAGERMLALDVDWFYRKAAPTTRAIFVNAVDDAFGATEQHVKKAASWVASRFDNPMTWLNPWLSPGLTATRYSAPIGTVMAFVLFVFIALGIAFLF